MEELKKIYDRNPIALFAMAVSHLLDIGFRTAKDITDEEIEELEGNGLMTKAFVQDLVSLSREIAQNCEHNTTLIQFCEKYEVFDSGDIRRERLKNLFCNYVCNDFEASSEDYVREALYQSGADDYELEQIGLGWLINEEE